MLKKQSISENATFLKEEYGTGGSAPAIGLININHDSKGITFSRSRQDVYKRQGLYLAVMAMAGIAVLVISRKSKKKDGDMSE